MKMRAAAALAATVLTATSAYAEDLEFLVVNESSADLVEFNVNSFTAQRVYAILVRTLKDHSWSPRFRLSFAFSGAPHRHRSVIPGLEGEQ